MNGRLLPFGWFKLLRGMSKITALRAFALGVLKEHHKTGLGVVCYEELISRAQKRHVARGEMSWVLEDNHALNKSMSFFDARVYKRYRIFEKAL